MYIPMLLSWYNCEQTCCFLCRREDWSKLLQNVHFYPNTHYVFSAMVKLVNQSDAVVGENIDLVWYYEGVFENSKCGCI